MRPFARRRQLLALFAATPVATGLRDVGAQPAPAATIAAASDLKFALEEVIALFERETGQPLRVSYGSSGQFFSQILQGAPFHVFLSADESFVFRLADAGRTRDRGRLYAYGRIGLFVGLRSPLKADGSLKDLAASLKDGRVRKFAIASPEHAPYGMRAREALQHVGLWQAILPRLVFGENVSQAAQFVTSGAAEGGIIAYSLARAPQLAQAGRFDLISEAWHQPLAQRVVLLKDAPRAAVEFYDFLTTPRVQAILMRYGFTPPQSSTLTPTAPR
ncbi:MAG: molybdate ABC transporter substrate-binding protein [Casimicrobiaceae bacterium]|nr:molybdate ABC transporter substrate-binding protein [Casimicrobiaceae bacterium]MCX8099250.1 molybdate ABC transporter substrate-binding protein [Casimicrobiaceae bacterium]MDW8312757.1 molybdate ABC transporter substrate-binding protein [Burkholderiales bacterium]